MLFNTNGLLMKVTFFFNLKTNIYIFFAVFSSLFSVYAKPKPATTEQVYALATIQLPIALGSDINVTNEDGDTALHLAIRKNQFNTVKFCLIKVPMSILV